MASEAQEELCCRYGTRACGMPNNLYITNKKKNSVGTSNVFSGNGFGRGRPD